MTDAVDTTQWSLPGQTEMPRDELRVQLEVYGETILLRRVRERFRLGQDRLGGRDRQRVHPAPGLLLGAPAGGNPLVEPGRDRTGGGPLAAASSSGPWPCNGRRSSPPPGSGFPCRGWSSSAPRAGRPGSTPPWAGPPTPSSSSSRAPAFNVFRDGRVCPGSHRFPEEVGLIPEGFFQSFFSLTGDHPRSLEEAPRQPDCAMGGA